MLWSILAIAAVPAIGYVVMFWVMKKFYTGERFVDPSQKGTLYGNFWEDLDVASPRHHNDD